jgi:hypothetical protein
MTVGTGKFAIQNLSVYHVRVVNASNTLLGFVDGNDSVIIDLATNSTSAGGWVVNNALRLGYSAQTTWTTNETFANLTVEAPIIELDSDRVFYILRTSGGLLYGQVYNQTSNTFGSETLIRNASCASGAGAAKIDANTVMVASTTASSTAMQAVVLSISGTTITVNTATSATLPATISGNCHFFKAVPSGGFVYGYRDSTPTNYITPISVSGTTPTIGTTLTSFSASATSQVLAHTALDKIVLIQPENASTSGGIRAYSLSGSTLTAGTTVALAVATNTCNRFLKLTDTTFFYGVHATGSALTHVGVFSISGTTVTNYISANLASEVAQLTDAIVLSSTKVFFALGTSSQIYNNILTFTGSAVSLGTAQTASPASTSTFCIALSGSDLLVASGTARLTIYDTSGTGPTIKNSIAGAAGTTSWSRIDYTRYTGLSNNGTTIGAIAQPGAVQVSIFKDAIGTNIPAPGGTSATTTALVKALDNDKFAFVVTSLRTSPTVIINLRKVELA